jgi:hypothetical protein
VGIRRHALRDEFGVYRTFARSGLPLVALAQWGSNCGKNIPTISFPGLTLLFVSHILELKYLSIKNKGIRRIFMKCKMLLTLGLFAAAVTTFARIGDTYIQSTNRFGKALGHFKDKYAEVALFMFKGYAIFVRYRNDKSFEESYVFLTPGIINKIFKEENILKKTNLLDNYKNLKSLTLKQRNMLQYANCETIWKKVKNKGNDIIKMEAALEKRKVIADYYIKRKVLVITEKTTPHALRASDRDMQIAKSLCIPIGSTFEEWMNNWGTPYLIQAPKWCCFQSAQFAITVIFYNNRMSKAFKSHKLDSSLQELIQGMNGGISIKIRYRTPTRKALSKYSNDLATAKKCIKSHQRKNKISAAESQDVIDKTSRAYCVALRDDLLSIPENLMIALLECSTRSKWEKIPRRSIQELAYATRKNGRRIYGFYNINAKNLEIEYGDEKNIPNKSSVKE